MSGRSLDDIPGSWLCTPLRLFYQFQVFYSIIGSLGIAIYRILLIMHDNFVKNRVGLKNLTAIILFGGIFILVFIMYLGGAQHPLRPECMITPKKNVLEI